MFLYLTLLVILSTGSLFQSSTEVSSKVWLQPLPLALNVVGFALSTDIIATIFTVLCQSGLETAFPVQHTTSLE